jgi:FkbM family methyltransferase
MPSLSALNFIGSLKRNKAVYELAENLGLTGIAKRAQQRARAQGATLRLRREGIYWHRDNRIIIFPRNLRLVEYYLQHMETFLPRVIFQPLEAMLVADCRKPMEYYLPSGGRIELPTLAEPIDFFTGYFLKGGPTTGQIVLDAGAYCGETTIDMARMVGKSGRVFAFEPDAHSRRWLEKNIAASGLTNITVVPKGLWHSTTRMELYATGAPDSSLASDDSPHATDGARVQIDVLSPRDAFALIGRVPDFIKMDIEGAEVEVIEAMLPLLAHVAPRFAIASYHLRDGQRTSELISPWFERAGFSVETGYPHHQTTWAWRDASPSSRSPWFDESDALCAAAVGRV